MQKFQSQWTMTERTRPNNFSGNEKMPMLIQIPYAFTFINGPFYTDLYKNCYN